MPCLAEGDYARFVEFRAGSEKALGRLPGSAAGSCLWLRFNGLLIAACLTIKRVTSLQRTPVRICNVVHNNTIKYYKIQMY